MLGERRLSGAELPHDKGKGVHVSPLVQAGGVCAFRVKGTGCPALREREGAGELGGAVAQTAAEAALYCSLRLRLLPSRDELEVAAGTGIDLGPSLGRTDARRTVALCLRKQVRETEPNHLQYGFKLWSFRSARRVSGT